MNFKFKCEICRKEVKRGNKFTIEIYRRDSEDTLACELDAEFVCKKCVTRVKNKIYSMTKANN